MAAESQPMTAEARQLSLPMLLVLHLAPGVLATLIFVLLAAPIEEVGYPPLAAFLIAIAVGIIPTEMGVIAYAGRGGIRGADGILAAVPYRRRMSMREWLVLWPLLTVVAIIAFGLFTLVEPAIRDGLFGWLPAWFLTPLPLETVSDYSREAWIVTLAGFFLLNGLLGPAVEELYFRGYLLPRMTRFGLWAPLLNVTLFSLYHFWSPWQFVSRIVGVSPFAYAVWWKQNVYLGMLVHITLNTIAVASVVVIVMGRLD
jgi:uncharacterized protein